MLNSKFFFLPFSPFSYFLELHVIIGLSFDIFGSAICGYWCTRVIRIILTDLFSNTLTNVVLCFSLVYMTFYLGKAKQCEHCCPPGKRGNLGSALLLTPETSQPFLPLLFCRLTSLSSYLPPSLNSLFIVTPCPFLFASLPLGTLLPLYPLFSNSTGSPWLSPRRTWRSYLF